MKLFDFFKKADNRTRKRKTGDRGEDIATEYLKKNGYIIVERNWKHGKNEIDIIAQKHAEIYIIEVKTTASDRAESFKLPSEAVDREKRKNLTDCAREYINFRKRRFPTYVHEGYHFDVIEVYLNRETPEINHIKDAFFAEKGYKKWKT